jgi:hypothetical protein
LVKLREVRVEARARGHHPRNALWPGASDVTPVTFSFTRDGDEPMQ